MQCQRLRSRPRGRRRRRPYKVDADDCAVGSLLEALLAAQVDEQSGVGRA